MVTTTQTQNRYDHRLKELVRSTQDITSALQQEILYLRARLRKLKALLRVVLVVLQLSGYSLNHARVPDQKQKRLLLRAIERSRPTLPLRSVLRVIRLSQSRYHAWNRKEQCELDDRLPCPQNMPHQLTPDEVVHFAVLARSPPNRSFQSARGLPGETKSTQKPPRKQYPAPRW